MELGRAEAHPPATTTPPDGGPTRQLVRAGLEALGVERLALGIHDPSFPSTPGEETGRGAPASRGGLDFLRFASDLGFDTVQLGPQGLTSRANPSPYDGALFSREVLSIDLAALTTPEWGEILPRSALERLLASVPAGSEARVPHAWAFDAYRETLELAWRALWGGRRPEGHSAAGSGVAVRDLRQRFEAFRAARDGWLEPDALYETLAEHHRCGDWRAWPKALDRELWRPGLDGAVLARRHRLVHRYRRRLERFAFGQWVADEQHRRLRREARSLGLELFGDLPVGLSPRDFWRHRELFLESYRLGAPPSRTNPEGQPWGYPVHNPDLFFADGPFERPGLDRPPGPVMELLEARLERAFSELDGLRLDHPHGLVCPWVYCADDADPFHAVRHGARLFSSPNLPQHSTLARWSIARPEQLAAAGPRWAEGWERGLDAQQVERYGALMDRVMTVTRRHGRGPGHLALEVLSTLPHPLARVLERHGLGRFRVTPKADPGRAEDPYRSEHAAPGDWIVLGNHDTPPLWAVIEGWRAAGEVPARAAYLASRLATEPGPREALQRRLAERPVLLGQALLADALASRAGRVTLFFTDLLGMAEPYNRPGMVGEANWSLRVPPGYREQYTVARAAGAALDIPGALGLALRARFGPTGGPYAGLLARLEAL